MHRSVSAHGPTRQRQTRTTNEMKDTGQRAVAAITFNDNRSMSVDVESVTRIHSGQPMDVGDGEHWFLELIIRTETGTVALQLLSGDKDKLRIDSPEAAE